MLMSLLITRPLSPRWSAIAGAIGVAYFAAVAVALEALRTDNNPLKIVLSDYAHGPYGLWLNSAFLVLGLGTFALALGLWSWFHHRGHVPIGPLLLVVSGLGDMLAGLFDNDFPPPDLPPRSVSGAFHTLGSFTSLLAFDLAMFVLARQFRSRPEWRAFSRTALRLALVIVAAEGIWIVAHNFLYVGAIEDLLLVLILVWQLLTALQLYASSNAQQDNQDRVEQAVSKSAAHETADV
jgi:hypothetical membrane protein